MHLRRRQLFELEDLAWFPETIRDLALDYLRFLQARFALHRPMVALLRDALQRAGTNRVVDLCSGGGGPVQAIYEALAARGEAFEVTLTDRYPNVSAFRFLASLHPGGIAYSAEPVDATRVPAGLTGLRTMFNAFHHFSPAAARAVLADAVAAGQPIMICEIPERRLRNILPLFLTPVFIAIATPFIRPFRWRRLLWTYIIPLVPLMCWWDGIVSQFRAYTVPELLQLADGLDSFEWKAGRVPIGSASGHVSYLTGMPRRRFLDQL